MTRSDRDGPAKPSRRARPAASGGDPTPESGAVVLLTGGNPQIAKGYGDACVQRYIATMPGWKRGVGERLDRLISDAIPAVEKAVKWNSPLYGAERDNWVLSFRCFTRYVKVAFYNGTALDPPPPVGSRHDRVRYLHIHEEDQIDSAQFSAWVRQASALPGFRT